MPRYYDMDKLAELAQAKADTLLPAGKMAFLSVAKWLELLPAADIVPRSELVRLQSQINRLEKYDEERDIALHTRLIYSAKSEVATEIFDAIERLMFANRVGTFSGFCYSSDLKQSITELKKKYTEGKTNDNK